MTRKPKSRAKRKTAEEWCAQLGTPQENVETIRQIMTESYMAGQHDMRARAAAEVYRIWEIDPKGSPNNHTVTDLPIKREP